MTVNKIKSAKFCIESLNFISFSAKNVEFIDAEDSENKGWSFWGGWEMIRMSKCDFSSGSKYLNVSLHLPELALSLDVTTKEKEM